MGEALGDAFGSCRGDTRSSSALGHIWAWSFKSGVKPDGVAAGGAEPSLVGSDEEAFGKPVDLDFSRVSQKGLDLTVSFRAEPVCRDGPSTLDELPFGEDGSGLA